MMKTILVSGGTGLIGSHILPLLKKAGFRTHLLSRSEKAVPGWDAVFTWDVNQGKIDERAFEGVTHILHLAGAGIADSRWSDARKKEIIESRIQSAALILQVLQKRNQQIEAFISGSAVGWYGGKTDDLVHSENEPAATDFLGETCLKWEQSADAFASNTKRIVKIRTGVVLAREGGAFPKMSMPFRYFAGALLGSGKQQMPWIHIEDIARVFVEAALNETFQGAFNASATESCSNREFSNHLAQAMNRPLLPLAVPSFILKMLFGEMSAVVLEGSRVSNQKLKQTGFTFQFPDLNLALKQLLS
jgi:uncharacterized protein (TIGR01777 family)